MAFIPKNLLDVKIKSLSIHKESLKLTENASYHLEQCEDGNDVCISQAKAVLSERCQILKRSMINLEKEIEKLKKEI